GVARPDRAEIPHLCGRVFARRPHRRNHRGGRTAGRFRPGAPADGSVARSAARHGRGGVTNQSDFGWCPNSAAADLDFFSEDDLSVALTTDLDPAIAPIKLLGAR